MRSVVIDVKAMGAEGTKIITIRPDTYKMPNGKHTSHPAVAAKIVRQCHSYSVSESSSTKFPYDFKEIEIQPNYEGLSRAITLRKPGRK